MTTPTILARDPTTGKATVSREKGRQPAGEPKIKNFTFAIPILV